MTNFEYIILISLCVQNAWSIQRTEILPIMEPYNRTHCKIFYENSFDDLPKEYIAKLLVINENTGGTTIETIEDNLVKFQSCIPFEKHIFTIIFYDGKKETSNDFNYEPVNVTNVIKDHGCLNSDGTLGGEMEMKKKNKYFELCFKKMDIVNKNEALITVMTTFFKTKTQENNDTVTIKKKDLNHCSIGGAHYWIYVMFGGGGLVLSMIMLLSLITVYVYWKNKVRRMKEESENKNMLYGLAEYHDDTKITERNSSYDLS